MYIQKTKFRAEIQFHFGNSPSASASNRRRYGSFDVFLIYILHVPAMVNLAEATVLATADAREFLADPVTALL